MRRRELQTDLIEYFIAAFIWGIRDHARFDEFWSSIYAANQAQDNLLSRFSSDGRALGLAVHAAVFRDADGQANYSVYETVDNFVDRYIEYTLNNTGKLPTTQEVATMARNSIVS